MDKSKKLKRYQRKDYKHLVSFPVEIVGRDGVVRRYSFESSVRLYQRRIASSRLRYHDPEVAAAMRALPSVRQLEPRYTASGEQARRDARRCAAQRGAAAHRQVGREPPRRG